MKSFLFQAPVVSEVLQSINCNVKLRSLKFTFIGLRERTCGDIMEVICQACMTNTPSGQQCGEAGSGGTSEEIL